MTRYRPAVLEDWIGRVEDASTARAAGIGQLVAGDSVLADIVADRQQGRERLFAALLTGSAQHLRTAAFAPEWVSWMEGQPPYHLLMTSDVVLVDLVPGNAADFAARYGCTPVQFARLVRTHPGSVRINIRNDHFPDYWADEVIDSMGEVLALVEEAPQAFYRLPPIRRQGYSMLVGDYADLEAQSRELSAGYEAFYSDHLAGKPRTGLHLVSRAGDWPPPSQFRGRVLYYLLSRSLWDGREGSPAAADPLVEEWLAPPGPLRFDPADIDLLVDRLARISTVHHLFSARLTGALGGTYAMLPEEYDFAASVRVGATPARVAEANVPLSSWLFALQAGLADIRLPSSDDLPIIGWTRPDDDQWRKFLDRLTRNRHILREHFNDLAAVLENAAAHRSEHGGDYLYPNRSAADLDKVLDQVLRRSLDPRFAATGARMAALLGLKMLPASVYVVAVSSVLGILGVLYACSKAFPRAADKCDMLEGLPDRLAPCRLDKIAICSVVDRLDLPRTAKRR